jgi:large subunit ribosomal protein L16
MLQPARTKYRKTHKPKSFGVATRGNTVAFGVYGLKATERGKISARQIEAARRAIIRKTGRGAKLWIRIFPDQPVTKKPAEVRMGSGKGSVEYYVAVIKPGHVLYEVEGVNEATAREAFRLAGAKLSIATTFVTRQRTV